MRLVRWFAGGAVIAFIVVFVGVILLDRTATVQIVVQDGDDHDIRVQIDGAVATPGVVTLPSGARLLDVVDAAGGFSDRADFTSLNLAGRVGDGEHVTIPSRTASPVNDTMPVSPSNSARVPELNGIVNLNTATAIELETLPGIGPVLAERIVDFREQHGRFSSIDDLDDVQGISTRLVDDLRPLVTVDEGG